MNVGLFLSRVDGAVSSTVDLDSLAKKYKDLASVKVYDNLLSGASQKSIIDEVAAKKLDGVVLAGQSPLFYKKTRNADRIFGLLREAGVNPNLIATVNMKEQVAMPHRSHPKEATAKAKVMIDVAIQKVMMSKPVELVGVTPKRRVLVIGTTVAGLFAGQGLAAMGYEVEFLDLPGREPVRAANEAVTPTLAYLQNSPRVSFVVSEITDFYGYPGNFRIAHADGRKLRVGAVIVAIPEDAEYTDKLYPYLRLERNDNGTFMNLHADTATVETAQPGIFMLPGADADITKVIPLADSACALVDGLLGHGDIQHELFVSEVDESVCGGCGTCIKTCIFGAAELDPVTKLSSTNFKRCVGCGNCVSACPTGAREQVSATTAYLVSAIKTLASYKASKGPKVLFLACEGCGMPGLDYAGKKGVEYTANVLPLVVRCAGRIDTQLILDAFREGFDGVAICKCKNDHCLNIVGNVDLDRRANLFRAVLKSRGIESERLRIFGTIECEGGYCVENTVSFMDYLKGLGGHSNG